MTIERENGNRTEPRSIIDQYYSVEFSVKGLEPVYQFRIWNISVKGICILVREDSALVEHIAIGDVLNMKYHASEPVGAIDFMETEVKHITKDDHGKFRGHYMVGLSILNNQDTGNLRFENAS